jgi:hypothetical protein
MRAHEVVRGDRCLEQIAVPGSERAVQIPAVGHDPRFVERRPHWNTIAECAEHDASVVGEPVGDIAVEPAAAIVQCLGQIPMIERGVRRYAGLEQTVHELAIEVEAALIHGAGARWQDATPRDAEPVGIEPQFAHQRDVATPSTVVIAGHVARVTVRREARRSGESVPDARSGPVRQRRTLDLVRRRRGAPEKRVGKDGGVRHGSGTASVRERSVDGR